MYKPDKPESPGPGYYGRREDGAKTSARSGNRADRGELWEIIESPEPDKYDKYLAERIKEQRKRRVPSPPFKAGPDDRDVLTNKEPNPGPAFRVRVGKKRGVRQFGRAGRSRGDGEYAGEVLPESPGPAEYSPRLGDKSQGTIGRSIVFEFPTDTDRISPASYQDGDSKMVKPSYNVKFDPDLKKRRKF
jgi:hypothetical protein